MKRYLFFVFVCLVVVGIIVENYSGLSPLLILCLWLIFLLLFLFGIIKKFSPLLLLLLFFINSFFVGLFLHSENLINKKALPVKSSDLKNVKISCRIRDIYLLRKNKITFVAQTDSIIAGKIANKERMLLLFNVYGSKSYLKRLYTQLNIGDLIFTTGTITLPPDLDYPGGFDYRAYLLNKGIYGIVNIYYGSNLVHVRGSGDWFKNLVLRIRKGIDEKIHMVNHPVTAKLLRALLLADKSELSYSEKLDFINSGVVHVLAVSGLHVGYILLIFLFLFNRFGLVARYLLTISGLLLFMVVTGMPASVVRATLMAVFSICAFLLNRNYNFLNSIAFAALIILLFDSFQLFQPGFQLSFAAVLSILIFGKIFSNKIGRLQLNKTLKNLLLFFSITFAAQLGTLPFTVYYFHKISLIGMMANLLVIPLVGLILALGILTLTAQVISVYLAGIFAGVNFAFTEILFLIVRYSSNVPFAFLRINNISLIEVVIYFTTLILVIITLLKIKRKRTGAIIVVIMFLILFIQFKYFRKEYLPDKNLAIFHTEIKNDDYTLLHMPGRGNILVCSYLKSRGKHNFNNRIVQVLNNIGAGRISLLRLNLPVKRFNEYSFYLTNALKVDTLIVPVEYSFDRKRVMEYLKIKEIKREGNNGGVKLPKGVVDGDYSGINKLEFHWKSKKIVLLLPGYLRGNRKEIIDADILIVTSVKSDVLRRLEISRKCKLIICGLLKKQLLGIRQKLIDEIKKEGLSSKSVLVRFEQGKFYLIDWRKDFSKIEIK